MKVEVVGAMEVRRRLDDLARAGRDAAPLMRDIGEHVLNGTRDRFDGGPGRRGAALLGRYKAAQEAQRRRDPHPR